jgi:hypothetical protein
MDFSCRKADIQCLLGVGGPPGKTIPADIGFYDIRQKSPDEINTTPPETYTTYLSGPVIMKVIGVTGKITYTEWQSVQIELGISLVH